MKLKFVLFTLSLAVALPVLSQSVDEIRESSDYISGEGFGRSLREADNDALKSLISKISISVQSECERAGNGANVLCVRDNSLSVFELRNEAWEPAKSRTFGFWTLCA